MSAPKAGEPTAVEVNPPIRSVVEPSLKSTWKSSSFVSGSGASGIYLDGSFAFNIERDMVVKRGLCLEQTLSDSEVKELALTEVSGKCYNAAIRLLSYRPRSEAEIRTRLSQANAK